MKDHINKYYKWIYALFVLFVFLIIAFTQGYYNLQYELKGPSEGWGRNIKLGEIVPYKKAPSVFIDDDKSYVLITDGKDFINNTIDRITNVITKERIQIKNSELNKIVKHEWNNDFIFWTENYDLYYSIKQNNGKYSDKEILKNNVKDFQMLRENESCKLIVGADSGITIYEAKNSKITQMGEEYSFPNCYGVSLVKDNTGLLHIAAYSNDKDITYLTKYIILENGKWNLITEHEDNQISRGLKLTDIEIGIDNTDIYIFNHMTRWDSYGARSTIHYAVTPISDKDSELKFKRFYVFESEKNKKSTFLSIPRCTKVQDEKLRMVLVKNVTNIKNEDGNAIFEVELNNGVVQKTSKVTLDKAWIPNQNIQFINEVLIIAYLETAGSATYEVQYTENSYSFKESVKKVQPIDLLYAVINVIPGYVVGLFLGIVKALSYLPVLLILFIIEFFEIRKLRRKPVLIINISVILHLIIKLMTVGTFYNEISVQLMPDILKFTGAEYVYAIGIVIVSYLLTKMYKKVNSDVTYIPEYLIFLITDTVITMLIYTTYFV